MIILLRNFSTHLLLFINAVAKVFKGLRSFFALRSASLSVVSLRRGVVLFSLIGVIIVVGMLAFTMHNFVTNNVFKTRRLMDSQATTYLLRSAIACAMASLLEKIEDPNSDVFKTLTSESLKTGEALPIDTAPLNGIADDFREGSSGVTVYIENFQELDSNNLSETTGGYDVAERVCSLRLDAWAICGGVKRTISQEHTLKIVNLNPGILGKFSLFVKSPDSEDAYNRYANNINGWEDSRVSSADRSVPIILHNGGEFDDFTDTSENSWKERGYVFFGGKVNLNLTAGNDAAYGENFHFRSLGSSLLIPSFYSSIQPKTFSDPPAFSTNRFPTENTGSGFAPDFALGLRFLAHGYFTADGNDQNMNHKQRLDSFFKSSSNDVHPDMRSSVFHLFGSASSPSPTLVLGEVYRRFAVFSGIVLEYTGANTDRDAFLMYLPHKNSSSLAGISTVPSTVKPQSDGDLSSVGQINVDTVFVNLENMFDTLSDYYDYASKIQSEPYLRGHDFMYHQDSANFYPATSSFGTKEAVCQSSFELAMNSVFSRTNLFFKEGSLAQIPEDFLESKTVYVVETVEELTERFQDLSSKNWSFNAPILVIGADNSTSVLPALTFETGGLLVFEKGNVQISQINRGSDPDQILSICALNGNIELDLSQSESIEANLIALRGKLVNLTSFRAIEVEGGVAVMQFPADSFPAGGKITYNVLSDPSGKDYNLFYRIRISDVPYSVKGG